MTIPIRAARLAIVAAIAALLGTACSDGSTESDLGGQPTGPEPPTSSTPGPAPGGGAGDWLTYHGAPSRAGDGPATPAIVPSRVRVAWTGPTLDGAVYAEPLVDGGRVVAATEHGTLYGLDAHGGSVLWSRHLADPVTGGLECGDILPLGITGTPAIDPATHTVFAVAEKEDGEHLLAAIDDRSGAFLWERVIDPPSHRRRMAARHPSPANRLRALDARRSATSTVAQGRPGPDARASHTRTTCSSPRSTSRSSSQSS